MKVAPKPPKVPNGYAAMSEWALVQALLGSMA